MIVGFTGTGRGMTQSQVSTVTRLAVELNLSVLHHGDCLGADVQMHTIAKKLYAWIVVHPPENPKARAFCKGDRVLPPLPYLARNKEIVREAKIMIATPKDFHRPTSLRGQGTWTTIGYAEKAHVPLWIVYPDGDHEYRI